MNIDCDCIAFMFCYHGFNIVLGDKLNSYMKFLFLLQFKPLSDITILIFIFEL